jgi:hypothetical protein
MTTPPAPPAVIPRIDPSQMSARLTQLLDMREAAVAAQEEAEARVEAIKAGIAAEVAAAFPGHGIIDIPGTPYRKGLRLRYHQGKWYIPVKPLREKFPAVWNELAKQGKGWWQLHPLDGAGS